MIEINGAETAKAGFPWDALLGLLPHLIWAGLILLILHRVGSERLIALVGRVEKVAVAGFEVMLRAAVNERGGGSEVDLGRASRRLAASAALIEGARILWVDDAPDGNRLETRLLREAGAQVDIATSTEEALKKDAHVTYDLVLSDMVRGGDKEAGQAMARALLAREHPPAIIFYVGTAQRPAPAEAFGITDRPDELVHLVLDALARHRG